MRYTTLHAPVCFSTGARSILELVHSYSVKYWEVKEIEISIHLSYLSPAVDKQRDTLCIGNFAKLKKKSKKMRTRREEKGNNSKFVPLHRHYCRIILIFDKRTLSFNGEFCLVAEKNERRDREHEKKVRIWRKINNERGTGAEKRYRLRVDRVVLICRN